ncbi:MAG TPA: LamG-like jellyroll fold domain-containing protein [Sedimentisphaerales bacterium]|nr:LamG-like jellyroll fold domain-containing protein [Sedimentisphaerales bacterium]
MKDRFDKMTVLAVVFMAALASRPADADVVAYWTFDETSGTVLHDSSGNGHEGALVGGLSFDNDSVAGVVGNALHFDGSDDAVLFPKSFSLPSDAFTIAFWFSPDFPLNSGSEQFSLLDCSKFSRYFSVGFNRLRQGKVGFHFGDKEENNTLISETNGWNASTWYHICVTFDGNDLKMYVGGKQESTLRATGSHGSWQVRIGIDRSGKQAFRGRIDDMQIYGGALAAGTIARLGRPNPLLPSLSAAALEGERLIKEQNHREALVLLEKRVAEADEWRTKYPDDYLPGFDKLYFDLSLLLAKAKKASGLPGKEVEAHCGRAFALGKAPTDLPSLGSALLWLYENVSPQVYDDIVVSLLQAKAKALAAVDNEAAQMIGQGKSTTAVKFLEHSLAVFSRWQQQPSAADSAAVSALSDAYLLLGRAGQAAGMRKEDIAQAYGKAFGPSHFGLLPERSAALIWLLENQFAEEYTQAIKSFSQGAGVDDSIQEIVDNVFKDFESKKDWATYQGFLDALLTEAQYPSEWIILAESCLSDKADRWAKKYYSYVESKPRLKFSGDSMMAQTYLANEDFEKAAELYKDIVNRCGPEDDKGTFEFQLCRSLFYARGPREVLSQLESFIARYKSTHADLVEQAMLMKGRSHIQLGEIDKALEEFHQVSAEYPQTKQAPEADFFAGYCYMVQSKSAEAAETLERVARDYPESLWAAQARLCLTLQEAAR